MGRCGERAENGKECGQHTARGWTLCSHHRLAVIQARDRRAEDDALLRDMADLQKSATELSGRWINIVEAVQRYDKTLGLLVPSEMSVAAVAYKNASCEFARRVTKAVRATQAGARMTEGQVRVFQEMRAHAKAARGDLLVQLHRIKNVLGSL